MDLKIGTILKAILIIAGMVLGTETLAIFDEATVNQLSGAVAVLVAVGWDVFETFRLKKQGIVSTAPEVNVKAPGSPRALAAEEERGE